MLLLTLLFFSATLPAKLYFHNDFKYYDITFQGCTFEGELLSSPPMLNLQAGATQYFEWGESLDIPQFTSGNCTYYIPVLQEFVEFQWYVNNDWGHRYYGITSHPSYFTQLITLNKIHYFISDI